MTRDEAYREYEEALAEINKQARKATEKARATLHEQLKALRIAHHEELTATRTIEQKTKRR